MLGIRYGVLLFTHMPPRRTDHLINTLLMYIVYDGIELGVVELVQRGHQSPYEGDKPCKPALEIFTETHVAKDIQNLTDVTPARGLDAAGTGASGAVPCRLKAYLDCA